MGVVMGISVHQGVEVCMVDSMGRATFRTQGVPEQDLTLEEILSPETTDDK